MESIISFPSLSPNYLLKNRHVEAFTPFYSLHPIMKYFPMYCIGDSIRGRSSPGDNKGKYINMDIIYFNTH